MSLLCRLKNLVHKGLLKKEDLDRIVIIPKEQENKVIKMREATPEERESISKYIKNISKPTVVNFWNLDSKLCKDCKHWRDSDGAYRRGIGAESQCPINSKKVFEGNGYCYMFEPKENEVIK